MLISEIFKPESVKINLESEDKEELFEELVNFLVEVEHFDNREEILNCIWQREHKMTTGIAPNIAIPHTHIKNLKKTVGVLGMSKQGIEYDSLDGKPVHLVMLLLGDEKNPNQHLNILKNIATLLNNPDFYTQIMKSKSPSELTEVIIEFEDLLKFGEEKK
ncbi:MAG: PTS sugar transporter subunit IIA [Spirochaetes bacterium]|nr:PTS sugar transporter subunit IIA [Spirochaetota bacterium]